MSSRQAIASRFDALAPERDGWKRKNQYYYAAIERLCTSLIPPGKTVLELGCGTGDLLAAVKPSLGMGLDISRGMLCVARKKYPHLLFVQGDAELTPFAKPFDYIILSDLLGHLDDIWAMFRQVAEFAGPQTRLLITNYNFFWEPILTLGESWGLKMPQDYQNWFSLSDLKNLLFLSDFEVEREGAALLVPKHVPALSDWANRHLASRRPFRQMALVQYVVARIAAPVAPRPLSYSVIAPCRNEMGHIEDASGGYLRWAHIPRLSSWMELLPMARHRRSSR